MSNEKSPKDGAGNGAGNQAGGTRQAAQSNPLLEPGAAGPRPLITMTATIYSNGQVSVTGFPTNIDHFCNLMADVNRAAIKYFASKGAEVGKSDIILAQPRIIPAGGARGN